MSVSWLPLSHRKNITLPKLEFEIPIGQNYGGYCDYQNKKLVIVYSNDIKEEASIIAHEYRHWLQLEQRLLEIKVLPVRTDLKYEDMISWYFNNSESELDALIYQNKYAKSEISDWWLNKLVRKSKPNGDGTGLENR